MKWTSHLINVTIIDGEGRVNDIEIKKGDNFIIPSVVDKCEFIGNMTIVMSYC